MNLNKIGVIDEEPDEHFDDSQSKNDNANEQDVITIILGQPPLEQAQAVTTDAEAISLPDLRQEGKITTDVLPTSALDPPNPIPLSRVAGDKIIKQTEEDSLSNLASRHSKHRNIHERLYGLHEEKLLQQALTEQLKSMDLDDAEKTKTVKSPKGQRKSDYLYGLSKSLEMKRKQQRQQAEEEERKAHNPQLCPNSREIAETQAPSAVHLAITQGITPKRVVHSPPPPADDLECTFRPSINQTSPINSPETNREKEVPRYLQLIEKGELTKQKELKLKKELEEQEMREVRPPHRLAQEESDALVPNKPFLERNEEWGLKTIEKKQRIARELKEREETPISPPSSYEPISDQVGDNWKEETSGVQSHLHRQVRAREMRIEKPNYNTTRQYPPPPTTFKEFQLGKSRSQIKSLARPVEDLPPTPNHLN
ncbi:hypothetical protein BLNAU_6393 [Blattamonas nauphoetae]|uniref:Uncharacterized protein n=1 Tax=Blattamonas nauphoetae TaxID=2049346 RepID=A0ABQ9Y4I6_9EUKA|nr:hypothetical protein BLNAU_6393 [Blattamonas nauphoetae]